MANRLDKIVVVDVESTCWDKKTPRRRCLRAIPSDESEIIEIGVCVLNLETLAIEDNEGILVLPQKSTVSQFCTDLTTITQEMLEKSGISFKKACAILRDKYDSNNRIWMSWGDYDRRQFDRQCSHHKRAVCPSGRSRHRVDPFDAGTQYPFGPTHINMKNLFAINMRLSREVGMGAALKMLKMELDGTHHRGVDDARNIAQIACKVLKMSRFHS